VVMYDPESRGVELVPAEPYVGRPGTPGVDRPPAHLRNAYSIEEELYEAVTELVREYERVAPEIVEYEAFGTDGAAVLAVAHGVVFRAVKGVVRELRQQGLPVGYFRPITLRPFPTDALRRVAAGGVRLLVVESAYGQLARLVKEALSGLPAEVHGLYKPGVLVGQGEIADGIKTLVQGG
ncbi:MAG: ferredoxin oxidoreductase, partial [Firmicutes bacterium]|nr:ferredoxin oxidoreductase [Bacillota bacterium]